MSRNKTILLAGVLVASLPFLGIPSSWKTFLYVLIGLCLILMAVSGHVRRKSSGIEERREVITEVYVETSGRQGDEL